MTKETFFRIRVAVLLAVLAGVLVWAYLDTRNRHERNDWDRPLSVAFVLVRSGPLDERAATAFCDRVTALGEVLDTEEARYRAHTASPFVFSCFGPVDSKEPPPTIDGDGIVSAARATWARRSFAKTIDELAHVSPDAFDSRIYVVASAPLDAERELIEGDSENGGRIGVVKVELDASMVDFALFVATHELFHTLGASDKYDADGKTVVPGGLADPDRTPLLPQARADVMARARPIENGREIVPTSLAELGVGPATAKEIGWTR